MRTETTLTYTAPTGKRLTARVRGDDMSRPLSLRVNPRDPLASFRVDDEIRDVELLHVMHLPPPMGNFGGATPNATRMTWARARVRTAAPVPGHDSIIRLEPEDDHPAPGQQPKAGGAP